MSTETLFWLVVPGLATGIGGLALLVVRRPSHRMLDALLGFTAGVMLAATAFSLLVPALDLGSLWEVLAGFPGQRLRIAESDGRVEPTAAVRKNRNRIRIRPDGANRGRRHAPGQNAHPPGAK